MKKSSGCCRMFYSLSGYCLKVFCGCPSKKTKTNKFKMFLLEKLRD